MNKKVKIEKVFNTIYKNKYGDVLYNSKDTDYEIFDFIFRHAFYSFKLLIKDTETHKTTAFTVRPTLRYIHRQKRVHILGFLDIEVEMYSFFSLLKNINKISNEIGSHITANLSELNDNSEVKIIAKDLYSKLCQNDNIWFVPNIFVLGQDAVVDKNIINPVLFNIQDDFNCKSFFHIDMKLLSGDYVTINEPKHILTAAMDKTYEEPASDIFKENVNIWEKGFKNINNFDVVSDNYTLAVEFIIKNMLRIIEINDEG